MQFILTCPNGKQIDMSSDVLKQMDGEVDSSYILEKITYYKLTNQQNYAINRSRETSNR